MSTLLKQTNQAPVVETERLFLRAWRKEDFRPYHAIVQHPDVHRHFGPEPMGAEECWRRVMASAGCWELNGFGTWAVTRKSDGKLIGNAGIFTAWRDLEPEFGEEPEMGWIFSQEVHGQGMAGEACRAAITWVEANLAPIPIWAIIAPENAPSLKLADKLGFERHSETSYHGDPTVVLKRPAWRRSPAAATSATSASTRRSSAARAARRAGCGRGGADAAG